MIYAENSNIRFSAYFTKNGIPIEGLSPVVDIIRAGTEILAAQPTVEVGKGWYDYVLSGTDVDINDLYRATFMELVGDVDAQYLVAGGVVGPVEETWDVQISEHIIPGSFGEKVQLSTGSSGAAVNTVATGYLLTTGVQSSGTFEDTRTLDGVDHQHTPTIDSLDLYYQFEIGGDGLPTGVTISGRINGSNDTLDGVYAYNWVTSGWDRVGTYIGTNATENNEDTFNLLVAHVGTGADLGLVRIRFYAAAGLSNALLSIDRISVSYAIINRSVGYDGGAVWINTNGANEGIESYVDGTADNPVSTWAAAITIANNMGLSRFAIISGSSITLTGNSDNYAIVGVEYDLALGGQSIASTYIEGANVSGVGAGVDARFVDCKIGTASLPSCGMKHCAITASITLLSAGTYLIDSCFSGVAGTGSPSIDFGALIGNTNLNMRHYSGGIEIFNMGQAGIDNMSLEGHGQLKIAASCIGGTVALRGHFYVNDSAAGAVTLVDMANFDKDVFIPVINDTVWEDNNLARTTPDSAGRVLKDTGSGVVAILDLLQNSGVSIDPADQQEIANLVLGTGVATVEDTVDALSLAAIILGMYRATIDPISGKLIIRKSDGLQLFAEHNVVTTVDAEPITSVGLT